MPPYQKFGKALHSLRRKYHTTKRELCSALEINEEFLARLELGNERPTEEIVEQMISLFSLNDQLADNLWVLAGYPPSSLDELSTVQIAQMPLSELKVTYTDMVHISVNNFGVTLNFMQNSGPTNQPMVVSRLGMSKEHAKSVADIIYKTLDASDKQKASVKKLPLGLPAPKSDTEL
jgi:transcriptional regulator with XRE-family HTH domain